MMKNVYSQEPWKEFWDIKRAEKRIENFYSNQASHSFKLSMESNTVGYLFGHIDLIAEEDIYYIDEFFIAASDQHKGYGKKALEVLKNRLTCMNINRIELHTILDDLDFYKKCGFVKSDYLHCEIEL